MKASSHEIPHLSGLHYRQVDVFSQGPLTGNGLAVFWESSGLSSDLMHGLTRELRQFESIFLSATGRDNAFGARIFTYEEELDFAGHPILGAAAVLHEHHGTGPAAQWTFVLNRKDVGVATTRIDDGYEAVMDQGRPEFGPPLSPEHALPFLEALNVSPRHRSRDCPLQVVSTGLPYLIVPVSGGLEHTGVVRAGLQSLLAAVGAKFAYVLDVDAREGRTWDNEGRVEDIATGSAAGPAGAYLCRHGRAVCAETIVLHQGRFMGRPSRMDVRVAGNASEVNRVHVSGHVNMIATGVFD